MPEPKHLSDIVAPPTTKAMEMKPTFLSVIIAHLFIGMDHEDPYTLVNIQ